MGWEWDYCFETVYEWAGLECLLPRRLGGQVGQGPRRLVGGGGWSRHGEQGSEPVQSGARLRMGLTCL